MSQDLRPWSADSYVHQKSTNGGSASMVHGIIKEDNSFGTATSAGPSILQIGTSWIKTKGTLSEDGYLFGHEMS